jgi:hypothetical protein
MTVLFLSSMARQRLRIADTSTAHEISASSYLGKKLVVDVEPVEEILCTWKPDLNLLILGQSNAFHRFSFDAIIS